MTTQTQTHTGRIYVACLASYNAGILHGEWIEATADADELKARVQAMLDRSPEAYVSNCGTWNKECFEEHYCGAIPAHQEDKKKWCEDQFMECCPLSGHEREFFETWCDWEKIAYCWEFGYTFVEYRNKYHIFSE